MSEFQSNSPSDQSTNQSTPTLDSEAAQSPMTPSGGDNLRAGYQLLGAIDNITPALHSSIEHVVNSFGVPAEGPEPQGAPASAEQVRALVQKMESAGLPADRMRYAMTAA